MDSDPADSAAYRAAFARVPTAVAVIAASVDAVPIGVSVGSFSSVSLHPPLAGLFIAAASTTWPTIQSTGGFAASVLSAAQDEVSRTFSRSGVDRFAACSWTYSPAGRPVIEHAVAWFDCTIVQQVPAGDHTFVVGEITAMSATDEVDPLVFLGGGYTHAVSPAPGDRPW